jgi:tRNA-dihydrouridine synthase
MHQLFTTNPDFLEFCQATEILDHVNSWLKSGLDENYDKAIELIKKTELPQTIIIGNGDVIDYEDGIVKAKESGVDGIMIGRGIFKNPWAFLPREKQLELDTKQNRIKLLLEHLEGWNSTWGDIKTLKHHPDFVANSPHNINLKNFASMKKFVKMYISNFEGALDLRVQFMNLNTCGEMIELCKNKLDKNGFNANNIE